MAGEIRVHIIAKDLASPSIRGVAGSLRSLQTEGRNVGGAFSFLRDVAASAMGFISANIVNNGVMALRNLGAEALSATMNFERLSIMLEGMVARDLKRASDGALSYSDALKQAGVSSQELLQWIEQLAIRSPYATSAVTESFAQMARYGFPIEEAKAMTQALLDMGAGSGLTTAELNRAAYALGQIYAADKLLIQDLRQLMNAGIDVRSILDRMGESFESLKDKQDKGGVSTRAFLEAFREVASEDYAGNLDRMTKSWAGMAGALQDVKEIGLRKLFQGVLEVLQPLVARFTDWILGPGLMRLEAIGKSLGELTAKIIDVGEAFFDAGPLSLEFAEALQLFGEDFGKTYRDGIMPVLEKLWEKFREIGGKIKNLLGTLFSEGFFSEAFRRSVYNLSPLLGDAYDVLSSRLKPIVDWIIQYKEPLLNAAKAVIAVFAGIKLFGMVSGVLSGLGAILSSLLSPIGLLVLSVGLLSFAWQTNFAGMRDQLTALYQESILPTFEAMKLKFGEMSVSLARMGIDWQRIWGIITGYFELAFANMRHQFGMVLALIRGDFDAFGVHLREWLINIGEKFIAPLIKWLTGIEIDARKAITGFGTYAWMAMELLTLKVSNAIETMKANVINGFIAMYNAVLGQVNRFAGIAEQVIQRIGAAFSLTRFISIGKDIVDGIIKGVLDNAYRIALAFNGALIPVISAIKAVLGISSPSRVFAEIGQQMAAGLALGYRRGLGEMALSDPQLTPYPATTLAPVSVNVVINAQVSNEIDLQRMARQVAEEIRLRALQGRGAII